MNEPEKARANEVVRAPTTNAIVLFRSPATWTRKARHRTKIYEQWLAWASAETVPGGGKVEIFLRLIHFGLLTMQRKWTYTNRFTLSSPKRKRLKLRQQLQTRFCHWQNVCFSVREYSKTELSEF